MHGTLQKIATQIACEVPMCHLCSKAACRTTYMLPNMPSDTIDVGRMALQAHMSSLLR